MQSHQPPDNGNVDELVHLTLISVTENNHACSCIILDDNSQPYLLESLLVSLENKTKPYEIIDTRIDEIPSHKFTSNY